MKLNIRLQRNSTKVRMIARMDALNESVGGIMSVLSERFGPHDMERSELVALNDEQQRLVDNMKRLVAR